MKMRPFELALVVIFIVLFLLALIILGNIRGGGDGGANGAGVGKITIWGTLSNEVMKQLLYDLSDQSSAYDNVTYREIRPDQFEDTLTNALADGIGPDLIIYPHEMLVDLRRRIQPISFESLPERTIRDRYVDGAQIFALNDGMYALPIGVDPMVMYWNRDILGTEGFLQPPQTWESLVNTQFPALIDRDFDRTINRSVVAMGEYGNVQNGFGILSALMIQGGSSGVLVDAKGDYRVQLDTSPNGGQPLRAAADFYTRFSKPNNALYSWNRSFSGDREEFIAEDLALYFGFASEGPVLERMNPNLNFDIAEFPQGSSASVRRTYGKFYGISLLKAAPNPGGALAIMNSMGQSGVADAIAVSNDLAPVYRTTVAAGSNNVYGRISFQSAGISFGWLNPNIEEVDTIFANMTRDINENRRDVSGATSDAVGRISNAY